MLATEFRKVAKMPEHEMQAAELHEQVVRQDALEKKGGSIEPGKVNLDLDFVLSTGEEKHIHTDNQHDSEQYSDTPDDDEPNEYEKEKLRRSEYPPGFLWLHLMAEY